MQDIRNFLANFSNCTIFGAVIGSLGTLIFVVLIYIVLRLCKNKRNQKKLNHHHQPQSTLAPQLNKDERLYQTIGETKLEPVETLPQLPVDQPLELPSVRYSAFTFSTVSVGSSTIVDTEPTSQMKSNQNYPNGIVPNISRYDSLVAWMKSVSGLE